MNITKYYANKLADEIFGKAATSIPATYHLGLLTDADDDDFPDGTYTEVSGGSYARVSIANDKVTFSTAVDGAVDNEIDIHFPTATANWGVIKYFGLFDASSAGNLLAWGQINPLTGNPVTILSGRVASFLAGALTAEVS
jgi:hypothetical protein